MAKQMTDSTSAPTHEQITQRAYEIFMERGQPVGHDLDHWLEAERQLRASQQSNGGTHAASTQTRNTQDSARSQNGGRLQTQSRARK